MFSKIKKIKEIEIHEVPSFLKDYALSHTFVLYIVGERLVHILFEGTVYELFSHHVAGKVMALAFGGH